MSASSQPASKSSNQKIPQAIPDPTRAKLLEIAGRVFAERGYAAATVREICRRADANVAAVNYHFGDKMGLYTEVLTQLARAAQVERMRATMDQPGTPEEILRRVIQVRVQGLRSENRSDWHFRIVVREFTQPTTAMSRVIDKISRPLYERFLKLVGQIIEFPADHEKTRLCTHSIMGQIFLYAFASPVLSRLWPPIKMSSDQLDRIADHIADFSLAYLREVRSARRREKNFPKARRRTWQNSKSSQTLVNPKSNPAGHKR